MAGHLRWSSSGAVAALILAGCPTVVPVTNPPDGGGLSGSGGSASSSGGGSSGAASSSGESSTGGTSGVSSSSSSSGQGSTSGGSSGSTGSSIGAGSTSGGASGCEIGGTAYADGAANPANACQSCRPASSTTAWTNAQDGTGCGNGQFCGGGTCQAGCVIGGSFYPQGGINPSSGCYACEPVVSSSQWTALADGAGCGAGLDAGYQCCGTVCSNTQADPSNCGRCQATCASPVTTCLAGQCACPQAGDIDCGTACVDAQSDPNNCGACGTVCGSGASCQAGTCACGFGGASPCNANFGGACSGSQCLTPWADWPMPNPASTGLPNPASYDTSTPGIVKDNVTGLTWQQPVNAATMDWSQASAYCSSLSLAGLTGWRLPSEIELFSLVDFTATSGATIDATAFPNTPANYFWSSSPMAGDPSGAWVAEFSGGGAYSPGITFPWSVTGAMNVRCAR